MQRSAQISKIQENTIWDIVIIGGGATGLGAALDAVTRGYKTLLLEKTDFGKGTSSKSTKLVHGGVRYLAQGNYKLVREALKERGILLKNAPNITSTQAFVLPVFSYWQWFYYTVGLKLYDLLSGKLSLGKTKILGKQKTLNALPNINPNNLVGSVVYYDGQFNDTRLLIDIAKKARSNDACILNYFEVVGFNKFRNKANGVICKDVIANKEYSVNAKVIINASGVFADTLMKLDNNLHEPIIAASQGIHLVIDKVFFEGTNALMIPKTKDGRVLFAVPWNNVVVVGTTDTPINNISEDPIALEQEIDFILDHFNIYCSKKIFRNNVQSVFVGLRPLVNKKGKGHTALLSRDHSIIISDSGVVNITGGKWTTYRKMAQDAVDNAVFISGLAKKKCITHVLKINEIAEDELMLKHLKVYGKEALVIEKYINQSTYHQKKVHDALPIRIGEFMWIIENEMPQTIEDILARRTRILFTNASIAVEIAPLIAQLLQNYLKESDAWLQQQLQIFNHVAKKYMV